MSGILKISSTGPLPLVAIVVLVALLIVLIPLLLLGLVGAAFSRLGLSWTEAVAVILLMLLGSFVNIPLWTVQRTMKKTAGERPAVFDAFTGEAIPDERAITPISLNLGGAVIPGAVSVYLLLQMHHVIGESVYVQAGVALLIVAVITKILTTVTPASGVRAPLLVPAASALLCGVILTGSTGLAAAVVAFVAGTTGTLLGAGIFTIPSLKTTGIPSLSIGGAGTFGTVFICGILAALIA
ncbi:MAG: DUF1614 domain-containing protein [Methanoregula sp.]|nr:DUF1614 domain-containing protein [Methanoregula sp.]